MPGFDTLGTLKHILSTGHDYSWFVLTQKIIKKEFALSGSEQNPDITSKSWLRRAEEPPRQRARRRRSKPSRRRARISSSATICAIWSPA